MSIYAKSTDVPIERSKAEIEKTLSRYGAIAFAYFSSSKNALIEFQSHNRRIRFSLPMPNLNDDVFRFRFHGGKKTEDELCQRKSDLLFEQACRQKWRALSLAVKSKLETVESGISSFEDEFMAYIVLPGGKTVSDEVSKKIDLAYKSGQVGNLLSWDK